MKLLKDERCEMEREEESRDGNVGLKLLGGGALVFPFLAAKG